ncbi:hypothetical protein MAR_008176 [Mya arenaria]|uniref:Uncharacterized protein n=1 Tax=Mya arenaria TaxID=6604 RepID=A0ABY7DV71_MYAAR|nr:hypothetical protein MAR_008176 [Mya arenaria]
MSLKRRAHNVCTVGTQAGIFDTRPVAGYIVDLLEKCYEIHKVFTRCKADLERGREVLSEHEQSLTNLQSALDTFGNSVDVLGVRVSQENLSVIKVNGQVDALKRDIEEKRSRLQRRGSEFYHFASQLLQMQLQRVNADIEARYESAFEAQEKLAATEELREARQADQKQSLEELAAKTEGFEAAKWNLLDPNTRTLDMLPIYVSPARFREMEMEIEQMKQHQTSLTRRVQLQMDEREFLRQTAREIISRVQTLEKQVRKETGDHGWESPMTREPNWLPDMTTPTLWNMTPPLTPDQVTWIRDRNTRRPSATLVTGSDDNVEDDVTSDSVIILDMANEASTSV